MDNVEVGREGGRSGYFTGADSGTPLASTIEQNCLLVAVFLIYFQFRTPCIDLLKSVRPSPATTLNEFTNASTVSERLQPNHARPHILQSVARHTPT